MKIIFDSYEVSEKIDAIPYLKNRKLNKYYNRETSAAIIAVSKLFDGMDLDPYIPFYYATGLLEYEDYGLCHIVEDSLDDDLKFSQKLFLEKGISNVSPLSQFKILQNMPLSFVSLANGLRGDNAVIYASSWGLINYALNAPTDGNILLGAGKVYKDGSVESSFALVQKQDLKDIAFLSNSGEAIEIFRFWSKGGIV